MAYVVFNGTTGFTVDDTNPAQARAFAALYDRCGVSRCTVIDKTLFEIMCNMPFPVFAVSELAGWRPIAEVAAQRELWRLGCRAQAEILGLKQHGWKGRLMRLVMTPKVHQKIWEKVERGSLPMDFQAFNRFHHGGKVAAQDIGVMRNCIAVGERQGLAMAALKEVVARLETHRLAVAREAA